MLEEEGGSSSPPDGIGAWGGNDGGDRRIDGKALDRDRKARGRCPDGIESWDCDDCSRTADGRPLDGIEGWDSDGGATRDGNPDGIWARGGIETTWSEGEWACHCCGNGHNHNTKSASDKQGLLKFETRKSIYR